MPAPAPLRPRPPLCPHRVAAATLLAAALSLALPMARGQAQTRELTSQDRLALLYTTQLVVGHDGDPLIRLGLVQDRDRVEFTPSEPIRVLPQGEGGPEVELPGGVRYTVEVEEPRAGTYRHWVIVEKLPARAAAKAEALAEQWRGRDVGAVEIFEVGGLFALEGKVFDSRALLVGVAGSEDVARARALKTRLEARYGVVGRLHAEIERLPTARFRLSGDGLKVSVTSRDTLWIAPRPGRQDEVRYQVPGIPRAYGKGDVTRTYTGTLLLTPDRSGKIALINSLGAERVLKGVVPAEIYSTAPSAALRAQAIAARNEIFSAIGVRNLADPFMLRADVMDQVYGGVDVERDTTSAAVDATRGQVMFHQGQIIEAFYSSNAGGFTESNEHVWDMEPRPYLRGRADLPKEQVPASWRDGLDASELADFFASDAPTYSREAPVGSARLYRWDREVETSVAAKWLREAGVEMGRLTDARVLERGRSGRVVRLELIGSKGRHVVERELNVRRLFGGLRSGLFLMEPLRTTKGALRGWRFQGAGFGHGVGMCQTGAAGMAHRGKSHRDILAHYYQSVGLERLY